MHNYNSTPPRVNYSSSELIKNLKSEYKKLGNRLLKNDIWTNDVPNHKREIEYLLFCIENNYLFS